MTKEVAKPDRSRGSSVLNAPNAIVYEIPACPSEVANMISITSASEDPRSRKNQDIGEVEFAGGTERAEPRSRAGCPDEIEGVVVRWGAFDMRYGAARSENTEPRADIDAQSRA
jgi:hypothetical protein